MSDLSQVLEKIGLSDKEARVYLASLHLGGASIQDIAEEAGINRTTTYVIMRSLIEKGLASSFNKGKKRNFTVESPEQLKSVLAVQEKIVLEKRKELESVLPSLAEIYHSSERRPQVRFLEGKEGIHAMQDEMLRSDISETLSFSPLDEIYGAFPDYKDNFVQKRVRAKIFSKIIYTTSKGRLVDGDEEALRERRYVPKEKFPFSSSVAIYGNTVQITNLKEPLGGVVIENKQIADSLRIIFNLAWEAAAQYNR